MVHGAWSHRSVCELVLIGHGGGSLQIINVHTFEATAAHDILNPADADIDTSAIALREDWITNMKTLWLACHSAGVNAYVLDTVGSQIVERNGAVSHRLGRQDHTLTSANTGTLAGAAGAAPAEVSAVIRWKSLIASRHARGRTYVAPLTDTAAPGGNITAGLNTALDAYAAALRTRYHAGGAHDDWNLTVYSRPYDNPHGNYVKRVGGVLTVVSKPDYNGDSNFVTSHQIDQVVRSQRRRQVGVGA